MTTYTNEQLASMTPDQLKAVILQIQAESQVTATVTESTNTDTAAVTTDIIVAEQTDTEKAISQVKASIASLEAAGADLFKAEISALKEKLATLESQAAAEVAEIETEAIGFYDKYHTEIIVVAVLVILHVAGLFGL